MKMSHGSVLGTLVHTLGTEIVWRLRCHEGVSPSALPAESEFPALDAFVRGGGAGLASLGTRFAWA